MSILSSVFGGGKKANPMKDANQYLNQIPGVAHQGYDQYINSGNDASNRTNDIYKSLMDDPTAFINNLMKGYQPSEGYQFQKDALTKELGNTAAAGGIAGTPQDQMIQGEGIQKLLSGDMQQFLSNLFNTFNTGLKGTQGIADRGYDASGRLTDALGSSLNQQGGLAFNNAQAKNAQYSADSKGIWDMFGKTMGAGAGSFFGPIGTAAGTAVGSKLFGG